MSGLQDPARIILKLFPHRGLSGGMSLSGFLVVFLKGKTERALLDTLQVFVLLTAICNDGF